MAGLLCLAAATVLPAGAWAQTVLTLGHGAAPGNPRSVAAEKFAELVAEKTGGTVTIRIAGAEQLGNDVAMLTSLRTGSLDFTINSQGAASGLVPELAALGLPFLFDDPADAFDVLKGPVGEELSARFDAVGIVTLDWWDNGIRHITNAKRSINQPDDLKGLKIRTPADPMTVDIFRALGAATEQISFSELYVALQQGVVDGQENPLANIASSKLYEVNPFISLSAHKWESTPFLMSKIAAGRVSAEQLKALREAAVEAGNLQRRMMGEAEQKLRAEFEKNSKVTVNEPDREALRAATAPVYDAWKAKEFGTFVTSLVQAAGN
ncbi:TRAP transporter substrate-binding protein [Mesorhizobium sp. WSM2561]|uniref:TRAP transporter substrate-binding protein n=1 Tax=Mesorhizobium sp. WSM2561 TaxID=1040985 RepID=UPI0018DEA5CA|nr:TRAP transporter substrate-binding protein [Mesorhizobium sp. WSM2561]